MATKPATTLVALTAKRVGATTTREFEAGRRCRVERNGGCMGEFLVWFPGQYYAKVDAKALHEVVRYA